MRIIAGEFRRRLLNTPRDASVTRPIPDRVKESLFGLLRGHCEGANVFDGFSGTGAIGLEAVSRGAAGGVFVEQNAKAAGCVRQNLNAVCKSVGRDARDLEIVQADARSVPTGSVFAAGRVPDLVFIDPPYEIIPEVAPGLFDRLAVLLAPKPDAVVVFEAPGEIELAPAGWTRVKRLGKGARQPTVSFFRRAAGAG